MTAKLKIIVGAIGALVVLLLMILWAAFAWSGKTPIGPLINQVGALITIVVGLISAFFGHQAATSRAPELDAISVRGVVSSTLMAPLATTAPVIASGEVSAQAPASAAPAPALQ